MTPAAAARHWLAEVARAALPFEARWTELALRRTDPDLADRLHEQRGLFDAACIAGSGSEIDRHGAALCRGYAAAIRAMGSEPDDAYLLGSDPATGCKVAIGTQKAATERVREIHGQDVTWITPDEVACLMASVEAFKFVGAVRNKFPGAELVRRYEEAGT